MKRTLFSIFVLVSLVCSINGQRSESEIALREYFSDAEFFLAQEFYLDALSDYLQVYKRGYQDNANINYRIGICYLNIPGEKSKSIEYLEKAKKSVSNSYRESSLNEKKAPPDVYLFLGNAYRVNNQLNEAIKSYKEYKKLVPEEEVNLHKYADQQIEACNIATEFMASPVLVDFVNLGEMVNSSNNDYKAVLSGDGSTLVYMHRLPFYDAVYYSVKEGDVWSRPENITPQLLSDGDQFVCDLSYDGKTLLLTREDEFNSDIMISSFDEAENRWTESLPLGENINTKYWESHASFSKDYSTIFFASNRRGGDGEMDLYYAKLMPDGTYGEVQNIHELNTELNEDTPFITEDGQMLFFSSQGYTSMGGYDIFVSRKEGDSWGLPENLGYPVNSTDDDLFYFPIDNGSSALMSMISDTGFGGTDIHKIHYIELPLVLLPAEEEEEEPILLAEETDEELVPVEEVPVDIEEEADETDLHEEEDQVTPEPEEVITIEPEPDVTVEPEPIPEPEEEEVPVQEPVAERVVQQVELTPVLFGFDKSGLTAEGKSELDKIAALMKDNKAIKVVLTGFTDPLGPESYNLTLSKKRAQSALNYLISAGIEASRLSAVGKGETGFIAINTDEQGNDVPEGRKYNRRVEFEIKGYDTDIIKITRIDPVPEKLKVK